jgi:hypothetical protein
MADILIDNQSTPTTPAAGKSVIYVDSTAKRLTVLDDSGRANPAGGIDNGSIASQGPGFAADTWVTDSDLLVPSHGLQVRTYLRWEVSVSKTAAGTATPIYVIRLGTNRTTADTAILTLTGPAQTAAADVAVILIYATLRNTGASGVLQGTTSMGHNLAATGFANNASAIVEGTSAGFDTTAAGGKYFSLSINGGTSAAWTVTRVRSRMDW